MGIRLATIVIAAAGLLVAGCGLKSNDPFAGAPVAVRDRVPLPACGREERIRQEDGYDVAARACFVEAVKQSRPAELIITEPTIEGDPITWIARSHEDGTIEILVDATQDSFGSGGWSRTLCRSITPFEGNPPPGVAAELLFSWSDCADPVDLR